MGSEMCIRDRKWEAAKFDVARAALDAFGAAIGGGEPYLISNAEHVHCAAVTEAIVRSAGNHQAEKV